MLYLSTKNSQIN